MFGTPSLNNMKSLLNDDTAQYLDKIDYTSTWGVAHHMRFLMFANYIVTNNVKTVLDVGFGQNMLVRYLKDAGFAGTYVGIDMNSQYVKLAKEWQRIDPASFEIQYKEGDVSTVEGELYDCVVLGEVIEHIDKNKAELFMRQCKELLTGQGTILLSTPNKIAGKLNWPEDHVDEFEYEELVETCMMAGFDVLASYGLWNNTERTLNMLSTQDKMKYEKYATIVPKSLLNVFFCLQNPARSRAVLLVLGHNLIQPS